ncbi:SGF29 tudor-like domain-domain-containing protein [Naematelia encephala]|uniref:SGF29 tudor-like domain-domain-containing protein n=1 Tax=Naematelia encephala TaxID=71784 RepID=A0A1Y2B6Z0_9TREE|nr:SGF29 tudor-like domain-domain-containing protein [Naematelia encephala]
MSGGRGRPSLSRKAMPDNELAMTQTWHGLVDTLRLLPTIEDDRPANRQTLDDALDKLSVLIALRRGESVPPETVAASTPGVVMAKRKRSSSPGTPMSRELSGRQQRRDAYADQLPLAPGRKVAFRVPGQEGENWILATVRKCIQQDKMRYEVEDDDDKQTYNTTLRSLIPLPDPNAPIHTSAHPSNLEDFPKNAQVLALYPETTTFYRATVRSAPIPGTGMGLGVRGGSAAPKADREAKAEKYRLVFVDDGDNVLEVHKNLVVPFPGS